jgi:hypothetical protein
MWPTNKHKESRQRREDEFITKSISLHENKYDYSLVIGNFKNVDQPVDILCKRCNKVFKQAPYNHINGAGCKICNMRSHRKTLSQLIEEVNKIHGDYVYEFRDTVYNGNDGEHIDIWCLSCDSIVNILPYSLLRGIGCPCIRKCTSNTNNFIKHAIEKHGDKYDYSEVNYVDSKEKVNIFCNSCEISFLQSPNNHLIGHGCRKCGFEEVGKQNTKLFSDFLNQANEKHNNKFEYDESTYVNGSIEIGIYCKYHKINFKQTPHRHLNTLGCEKCFRELKYNGEISHDEWSERVVKKHGNKYDYSLVDKDTFEYKNKIKIICHKHGEFEQYPGAHTKHGCHSCAFSNKSGTENEWLDYLKIPVQHRQVKFKDLGGIKIDGHDLTTNTLYEFHGNYWHGNPVIYKSDKINSRNDYTFGELYEMTCERDNFIRSKGYNLVTIWESEWDKIKETLSKDLLDTLNIPAGYTLANIKKSDFLNFRDKRKLSPAKIAEIYSTTEILLEAKVKELFNLKLYKLVYNFIEDFTDEELDSIIETYTTLKSMDKTSKYHGVCPAFVRKVLKHKNVPLRYEKKKG